MQICYWCPFLTHIATIDAVKNSAISLKKFSNQTQNTKIKILNSFGEWNFYKNNNDNIIIHDLQKFNFHNKMPKEGFVSSRLTFLLIFFLNIIPILKYIKKEKPDYLVIHLLTILPIILSPFLSKKTKIILRISGLPSLHLVRSFCWKFFSKYLYLVTTPTNLTKNLLIEKKIFNIKKIKLLKDPIINNKIINNKKKELIDDLPINEDFYLSVGRLTKQKNFSFLIKNFAKNLHKFKINKLIIIGTGEEKQNLNKLIVRYNVQNNIFLLGFKKNIYKYLAKCTALISTSNYEDPGFAIIEACYLKKKVISSIVPNGPLEMYKYSNMCYFYKKNDEIDFVNKIITSENENSNKTKIISAIKYSKQFTLYSHYKDLIQLIR